MFPKQKEAKFLFDKWLMNEGEIPEMKILSDDATFTAKSREGNAVITYKVVDVNYPHGSINLNDNFNEDNNDQDEVLVASITEEVDPLTGTPIGATAIPDKSKYDYEFIN